MGLGRDRQESEELAWSDDLAIFIADYKAVAPSESRKHGGSLSIAWMDPTFFAVTSHFREQMHPSNCNRSEKKLSLQPDVAS
jgi:hypothetical protein